MYTIRYLDGMYIYVYIYIFMNIYCARVCCRFYNLMYLEGLLGLSVYGKADRPLLKKYLMAVNLVANKVVDGHGRTITKSDLH